MQTYEDINTHQRVKTKTPLAAAKKLFKVNKAAMTVSFTQVSNGGRFDFPASQLTLEAKARGGGRGVKSAKGMQLWLEADAD